MAVETENIQCPDCGAAVRSGASFCFKCGKHFGLAGAGNTPPENTDATIDAAAVEMTEAAASVDEPDLSRTIPDTPAILRENNEEAAAPESEPGSAVKPVAVKAKPQLTTAATMRRKPKPQREKIEMVWEQPEGTSNPVFVIGTIVIFVLVLVILLAVYFVK
jgi:cobalamin biosynthesis Mg chelatase CobN